MSFISILIRIESRLSKIPESHETDHEEETNTLDGGLCSKDRNANSMGTQELVVEEFFHILPFSNSSYGTIVWQMVVHKRMRTPLL